MAKKLRKSLGNMSDATVTDLMNLIDSQSKATLARWSADFAAEVILPIYEKHNPGDDRPRRALSAVFDFLNGKVKFAAIKELKSTECAGMAKSLEKSPAAQAAARAIIDTGIMVYQTPTHTLGMLWYSAAAVAYDQAGLDAADAVYDKIAVDVAADYLRRLKAVAVEKDPNPVKCKWFC